MGISSSADEQKKKLAEPFTHKHKIKGLDLMRGPTGKNKFIILDDDFKSETAPIKFRYNTNTNDDWQWEWTSHPTENIWYSVKDTHYQITAFELKKPPYNILIQFIDTNNIIRVNLPIRKEKKQSDEYNYKNNNISENNPPTSPYNYDLKIPRFQIPLPAKYDNIRTILCKKDPIPPHILNEYDLATNAYEQVLQSELSNAKIIKCKFATKDLSSGGVGAQLKKHPILMFFENEPNKIDDVVWVLHLIKDSRTLKARVEFDPKLWKKFCRDGCGWKVSDKTVIINQAISLLDIAKWCVQYENQHKDYTELHNNCRKFMLLLSKYINVHWDEIMMLEKIWYTALPDHDNHTYNCFST